MGVNLLSERGQLLAAKKTKNVSGERDNSRVMQTQAA